MAVRFGVLFGMLFCGVGIFLLTGVQGGTPHLIGLGGWWFGVLLIFDSLIGGGRPAQFLWGIGVATAVWAYSEGLAQKATEGAGLLVVAVPNALIAGVVAVRFVRSWRSAARRHTANGELQAALSCWDTARDRISAGQRSRAARAYQEGISHFLWCVNLTRSGREPLDLTAATGRSHAGVPRHGGDGQGRGSRTATGARDAPGGGPRPDGARRFPSRGSGQGES